MIVPNVRLTVITVISCHSSDYYFQLFYLQLIDCNWLGGYGNLDMAYCVFCSKIDTTFNKLSFIFRGEGEITLLSPPGKIFSLHLMCVFLSFKSLSFSMDHIYLKDEQRNNRNFLFITRPFFAQS